VDDPKRLIPRLTADARLKSRSPRGRHGSSPTAYAPTASLTTGLGSSMASLPGGESGGVVEVVEVGEVGKGTLWAHVVGVMVTEV
jgi:hypothetical protein